MHQGIGGVRKEVTMRSTVEQVAIPVKEHILEGELSCGRTAANGAVLILHPHPLYGGDMRNNVVLKLEEVFVGLGYLTLRFNFRGVGGVRSQFSGVTGALEDAYGALAFLRSRSGSEIVGMAGYSFGASVALKMISHVDTDFLVLLSASMRIFQDGLQTHQSTKRASGLPALLFHGSADKVVPHEDMSVIAEMLDYDSVQCVTLDGEGHFYNKSLGKVAESVQAFMHQVESRTLMTKTDLRESDSG